MNSLKRIKRSAAGRYNRKRKDPLNRALTWFFAALLLSAVLVLAAAPTLADRSDPPTYLFTGGWSTHFIGAKSVTNETHNILAVEHRGWTGGYFRNSYGDDSLFVGKAFHWSPFEDVDTFAVAGAGYGYKNCPGVRVRGDKRLCPGAFVGAAYTARPVQPALLLGPGVAVFSVRWALDL